MATPTPRPAADRLQRPASLSTARAARLVARAPPSQPIPASVTTRGARPPWSPPGRPCRPQGRSCTCRRGAGRPAGRPGSRRRRPAAGHADAKGRPGERRREGAPLQPGHHQGGEQAPGGGRQGRPGHPPGPVQLGGQADGQQGRARPEQHHHPPKAGRPFGGPLDSSRPPDDRGLAAPAQLGPGAEPAVPQRRRQPDVPGDQPGLPIGDVVVGTTVLFVLARTRMGSGTRETPLPFRKPEAEAVDEEEAGASVDAWGCSCPTSPSSGRSWSAPSPTSSRAPWTGSPPGAAPSSSWPWPSTAPRS